MVEEPIQINQYNMKNGVIAWLATIGVLAILLTILPKWLVGILATFSFILMLYFEDSIRNKKD